MKSLKLFIPAVIVLINLILNTVTGQVLISSVPGSPVATSMLEITSTSKGLLIPRMTTSERDMIGTPALSLMIFNTSTNTYNYWNGSAWIIMAAGNIKEISDANNNTKVEVERTPDEDLIHFKVDGVELGYFNDNSFQFFGQGSSIFIGEDAGLNDDGTNNANTFVGAFSGGSITTGEHNVSMGASSSENIVSGSENTILGYGAGNGNNASGNTFIGAMAGEANFAGIGNVFVGKDAGKLSTVSNNTFIGFEAGKNNSTGTSNTYVGQGAGDFSTASNNTFIGQDAGTNNTSGGGNTYIGQGAGELNFDGTNNTCIGRGANLNSSNLTNATAIGAFASVFQDNSLVLGAGADVGIGTTSPDARLEVVKGVSGSTPIALIYNQNDNNTDFCNGLAIKAGHNGYNATFQSSLISFQIPSGTVIGTVTQNGALSVAYNTTSDERLKTNIHNTRFGMSDIMKIQVCDYVYNNNADDEQTGYLAQQLYTIFPAAVHEGGDNADSNPWMVDYGRITPLLVKGIQEEQIEIQTLQSTISTLISQVELLKSRIALLEDKSE